MTVPPADRGKGSEPSLHGSKLRALSPILNADSAKPGLRCPLAKSGRNQGTREIRGQKSGEIRGHVLNSKSGDTYSISYRIPDAESVDRTIPDPDIMKSGDTYSIR